MSCVSQLTNKTVGVISYFEVEIWTGEKEATRSNFHENNNHVALNKYAFIQGNTAPPNCHRTFFSSFFQILIFFMQPLVTVIFA